MIRFLSGMGLGLMLVILTGCFLSEQRRFDHMWPEKYELGSPLQLASVREGYIRKKTGDTLRGYIRMVTLNDHKDKITDVPLLPFNKRDKSDIINVPVEDIDYARIQSTHHAGPSDYMPIGAAMWQILAEKGRVRVCFQPWQNNYSYNDDTYLPDAEMKLVVGKEIIDIPLNGKVSSRTVAIREFINTRYTKHFEKADFKSDQDMINYIAEEEDRRQKPENK